MNSKTARAVAEALRNTRPHLSHNKMHDYVRAEQWATTTSRVINALSASSRVHKFDVGEFIDACDWFKNSEMMCILEKTINPTNET